MATVAKKNNKKATSSKGVFAKKHVIIGLVTLSVLGNVVFISLLVLVRYTNYFDYAGINNFIARDLDDNGCIKPGGLAAQYPPDVAKYGAGAKYCLDLTPLVVSQSGEIILPEGLKGQKVPLRH